ncbi:hypothetical protein [Limosilactobacillus fastidiosus]|uniref:Uncharacterized protein n=1 Tax=Limosilactobacillus fastidiosus TaxID=2759855 RepID=A0A7W3U0F6_9LACO|nr:hypothetical protein [Limosilactobacillus fastidiosus]MBB1086375.1 hypothetical protein [Limosilactobacillus fastidiosus]MCD7086250.1 hypothetical protein [Limosilactobacillus fastidiosus]MCD7115013.1 hypothetical protein [Limosilactobacillus fastidiosus]MCD7116824.1 hypothetical protein [Limosilactobacillus fastidiosus]
MIFNHRIRFYSKAERKYNPRTHQYEGEPKLVDSIPANVTDVGTNRSVQLFGNYNQNSKVVRTIKEPPSVWDYVMIDNHGAKYVLQTSRKPLKYYTLIVGESNGKN